MTPPTPPSISELAAAIRNVPDFPKPGIQFKDITPVLADARLFQGLVHHLAQGYAPGSVDAVVGIDARGFILGAAVAHSLQTGFIPIRKKGKLPYNTHEVEYDLEYGSNSIAVHVDALTPGHRVLLVDDLLATGGTAIAAMSLLSKLQVTLVEAVFFIELAFLNAKPLLQPTPVRSLVVFK